MRIQLLCDQKWRDLPNLTVIKLCLEKRGHRVLLSTTKDARPMIKAFRPDCVVINHLFGSTHQELAKTLRANGCAVVLLPTEGMTHPHALSLIAGEAMDLRGADLILVWNEPLAALMRELNGLDAAVTPVIGCTRFDFYHPKFAQAVTTRETFCRQYGFDPTRPVVTWATQYVFAHIDSDPAAREKFLRESADFRLKPYYDRIGITAIEMISVHAESRRKAAAAFVKLATALPDAQFVIKPHPAENRDFYGSMMREVATDNVRLCPRDYIWNVLNVSDVHLHKHCTTAIEAWNWDKPTIEMSMNAKAEPTWPEREAGSDVARDADELVAQVRSYVNGASVDEARRATRQAYIHYWYGAAEGARCAAAAAEIDRFLAARGQKRRYFSRLPGIAGSPRQVATAVARYALGRRPNESLVRRVPAAVLDPNDKHITRRDVQTYSRLVAPALQ